MSAEIKKKNTVPLGFIGIFAVLTAGFMVAGFLGYQGYEKRYRAQVERELSAIADLKVEELKQWRRERLGDAKIIFNNTALFRQTSHYFRNPQDDGVEQQMRVWVSQYQGHYDYDEVSLLDPKGAVRMSSPSGRTVVPAAVLQSVPEVLRSGRITFVDFYLHDHDQRIYLSVLIPILDVSTGNRAIGAISLRVDPEKYLFPFILRWPTPSTTAETVLVRREGDAVLYLNELKFRKDAALRLRIPLTRTDVPPVMAALGRTGIVEGPDHQNEQVIADVRAVPGSPWFLVTRMNASEVYAPMRERLWTFLGLVAALLFGAGAGLAFVWRQQALLYYRERFQAAEALDKGRHMLAETEKLGKVGGWELNIDTGKLTWTEELYNLHEADLAYDPTAGKVTDFYTPASRPLIERAVHRAVEHGEPFDERLEIITAKGNRRSVHVRGKADLEHRRVYGFIQDITENKRAEQILRSKSELLERIFATTHFSLVYLDREFNFIRVNTAYAKACGCPEDFFPGKNHFQLYPNAENEAIFREVVKTGNAFMIRAKPFANPGHPEWGITYWDWTLHPLKDADGNVEALLLVLLDVTESKRAEQALRDAEARYRLLFEQSPNGVLLIDFETGKAVETNEVAHRQLGYTREEFAALRISDYEVLERPEDTERRIDKILRDGGDDFDTLHRTKSGELRNVHVSVKALELGGRVFAYCIFQDITERMQAEQRYQHILKTAIDGFWVSDSHGRLLEVNDAYCRMSGYSREELMLMSVADLDVVENQEEIARHIDKVIRQGYERFESRHRRKDGTIMDLEISAQYLHEHGGIFISFFQDITGRKKLEDQLRQAQKMESIGTLAGGVAHDFNNILTAISGSGHLLLMKMPAGDPLLQNVRDILESVERAVHLTRDLLLFSRKQPINRKSVDLNENIHKLGRFLARVIGEDIEFKTRLSGGAIRILADSHQLDQVLMNLATNARDAMPKGGAFSVTTDQVLLDETFTSAHGLGTPGKYALITVSDTGRGMNEDTRQRIFEPFFTTKEVGKGTGLGMAVVYGIVKQHDGLVTVYSEPGQGTTFRIYLPVIAGAAIEERENVAEERPVGGPETILLAEDNKSVRNVTANILRDMGYRVITAEDGVDAIEKFTENRDSIQLLLFDLIMPNKSGKDAYDEIRRMRPDIKVIFASGYDPDLVRQKTLLEQNVPVVYKPVPIPALLKKIRTVLDEEKGQ